MNSITNILKPLEKLESLKDKICRTLSNSKKFTPSWLKNENSLKQLDRKQKIKIYRFWNQVIVRNSFSINKKQVHVTGKREAPSLTP